mgnify:CR=1 FL=1|jgi:hypothetical protein
MAETLDQLVQRLRNRYTAETEVNKTDDFENGNPEFEVLLKHVIPTEDGDEFVDDYERYYVIIDGNGLVLRIWDECQKSCADGE